MNAMRHVTTLFVLGALASATASCGDVARSGRAPVYLVIDSLGGAAGGSASTQAGAVLHSDVLTRVTSPAPCSPTEPCYTIFSDSGDVALRTALKDVTGTVAPSTNNDVTITRYHVSYRRADGRNTQGVDVPYAFDGAITVTVPAAGTAHSGFELVRHDAKMESPLVQLVTNPQIITTIADVTFYGRDVVGTEIQATGSIQVDFGNFGDF
jgi:hypothetical protein